MSGGRHGPPGVGSPASRNRPGDTATPTARFFPGWRVVAGAFVILAVTSGLCFYNLSVYLTALKDAHGFSEGALGIATALVFGVTGVVGLLAGNRISGHDVRPVIVFGAVTGAVALFLLGRVEELWQLYLVYVLFAVGFGSAGLVPCTTVVTRWFHRKRAVALATASTGLSVGGIVFTPLSERMISWWELSGATPWFALAWAGIIIPVALLVLLPEPTALGYHPDNDPEPPPEGVGAGIRWEEARTSAFFLAVTAAYVLIFAGQVGGIAHLFNLVDTRDGSSTAALAVSAVAASSVVARLAGGAIADRVPLRAFTAGWCVVQGAGLILLGFLDGRTPLLLASVVFGASIGNLLMLQSVLIADAFGVSDFGRIYGRAQLWSTIGLVVGPSAIGLLQDTTHSYVLPYTIAGGATIVAGVLLVTWAHDHPVAAAAGAATP